MCAASAASGKQPFVTPSMTPSGMDSNDTGELWRTNAATAHAQTDVRGPRWTSLTAFRKPSVVGSNPTFGSTF